MASIFNVLTNPFSTQVGQKIENATDSNQVPENWTLILEVCDYINGTEDGPKDAIRAIKKRLQQSAGKNHKIVSHTLTLLEACVKNCDRRFHVCVCNEDFIQELVKLIDPKNDLPEDVQEKVLSLIQSWADAFRGESDMSAVVRMYNKLKAKHIVFPMTDLDAMAPIHTPPKTVSHLSTGTPKHMARRAVASGDLQSIRPDVVDAGDAVRLTPEQLAKLRSELDIVQENMSVLNELLTEVVPGQEHPPDLELLTQLYSTCKAMQNRLVELISQLASDEVTAELLRINDLLNNLFLRYSRYEKNRSANAQPQSTLDQGAPPIDLLGDDVDSVKTETLVNDFEHLSMKKPDLTELTGKPQSDFDMFAQSRSASYENSKKSGSTYEDNLKPDQVRGGIASVTLSRSQPPSLMHRESDFDEMAAWLEEQDATEPDSITSSEFDRFLAERAAAVENIPSHSSELPTTAGSASTSSRTTPSQRNKYTSKDMYAL